MKQRAEMACTAGYGSLHKKDCFVIIDGGIACRDYEIMGPEVLSRVRWV